MKFILPYQEIGREQETLATSDIPVKKQQSYNALCSIYLQFPIMGADLYKKDSKYIQLLIYFCYSQFNQLNNYCIFRYNEAYIPVQIMHVISA